MISEKCCFNSCLIVTEGDTALSLAGSLGIRSDIIIEGNCGNLYASPSCHEFGLFLGFRFAWIAPLSTIF